MALRIEKVHYKVVDGAVVYGPDVIETLADGKRFTGKILEVGENRVTQNIGRGTAAIHDSQCLDRVPGVGEAVCIMYGHGRGQVVEVLKSRDREQVPSE